MMRENEVQVDRLDLAGLCEVSLRVSRFVFKIFSSACLFPTFDFTSSSFFRKSVLLKMRVMIIKKIESCQSVEGVGSNLKFFTLLEKNPMWLPKQGSVLRGSLRIGFTLGRKMISAGY